MIPEPMIEETSVQTAEAQPSSAPASGSPARRTIHMSVSIEGVLRWPDKDLRNMFTDDAGNRQPANLVRDFLKLELAKGRRVLPMGEPCEGWSYETGCPGHVVLENHSSTTPVHI